MHKENLYSRACEKVTRVTPFPIKQERKTGLMSGWHALASSAYVPPPPSNMTFFTPRSTRSSSWVAIETRDVNLLAILGPVFRCAPQRKKPCGACAHRWHTLRESVLPLDLARLVGEYAVHTCSVDTSAIATIILAYEAPVTAGTGWGARLEVTLSRTGDLLSQCYLAATRRAHP